MVKDRSFPDKIRVVHAPEDRERMAHHRAASPVPGVMLIELPASATVGAGGAVASSHG
jgi:hypothetical protein